MFSLSCSATSKAQGILAVRGEVQEQQARSDDSSRESE